MSFGESPENKFESLIKASDGELVKESEIEEHEQNLQMRHSSSDKNTDSGEEKIDSGRRKFIIGSATAAAGAIVGTRILGKIYKKDHTDDKKEDTPEHNEISDQKIEREPVDLTPTEQFVQFGEIKNLHTGIEAVKNEHFRHLTEDKNGVDDMKIAAKNMNALDLNKFTKPFVEVGLPPQLCYMIAVQETRGRNITSWAGARSIMGIMPKTAKNLGFAGANLNDPYVASTVSAKYCKEERGRFDEGDMILHAYNGGASLFKFTGQTQKKERTAKNFYHHMEEYMNTKFERYEGQGYFEARIRKGDTVSGFSRELSIPIDEILELNRMNEKSVLRIGEKIKLPFRNTKMILNKAFSKELEVLRYTPEVKAKYEVLKSQGLLARLESVSGEDLSDVV